ncbi:MAG: GNAT family N-acetyltransferase, partial [Chloroflexi bacterium]|nr:GNAT family N-acetyltransferase [Chloroflexota bacterium]
IVLLGHASYYPRFGFGSARDVGLEPPAAAWPDAAWMARLLPAWTDAMRGTVRYPEAFEPLA